MTEPVGGPQLPAPSTRTQVVDRLTELFAEDQLTLEQFESKLDQAHRATTNAELQAILPDVTIAEATVARPTPSLARVPEEVVAERSLIFGFWGGSSRSGTWTPARKNYVIAFQGGAELDLREAHFGPGVTEITVFCAMGGVSIIVPPELQVDFGGIGIMGGFDVEANTRAYSDPTAPVVRVRGVAIWGGAAVEIRELGETAAEARQRRRIGKKIRKELPTGDDYQ